MVQLQETLFALYVIEREAQKVFSHRLLSQSDYFLFLEEPWT